jgi:hypothetical protein
MGVRPDDKSAGESVRLVQHDLVADAFSDVVQFKPVLVGEFAHQCVELRDRPQGARGAVVDAKRRLPGHGDTVAAHALECLDSKGSGPVLGHREVELGDHDVAGAGVVP